MNGQDGVHGCRNTVPTHSETLPVQFAVLADDGKVVVKLIECVASCTTSVAALMDDSAYGDGEGPDIHCKLVNDAGKELEFLFSPQDRTLCEGTVGDQGFH